MGNSSCPTCHRLTLMLDRVCPACGTPLVLPELDWVPLPQDELVLPDELPTIPASLAPLPTLILPITASSADEQRRAKKDAKRAAVRRARLAQAARAEGVRATDVLVLDADDESQKVLCGLLGGFGFRVVCAKDCAHAASLADEQAFAAAFLDVRLDASDGGAGVDLCRRLQSLHGAMPVVLLAAGILPVDRIRARLAGCAAIIAKPAVRSEVARTLENAGVPLPRDARRH